jgi:oxygen-independent coproporphyrinogen-3 oxidase
MVLSVADDIAALTRASPLAGRAVEAIYLGGGSANLATPEEIAILVRALARDLRIHDAELTLEGTPHLFEGLFFSHLKALAKLPVGHRRISMGIQTFDEGALRLMGRERFGDAALVAKLVRRCHALDIAASGDLLFNLPGETLAQMERDVDVALGTGLDQICLYHLVLYPGLDTPWAREPELLAAVPDNGRACEHWLHLRERLLAAGYRQTTLTNFERADVGARRFRYEEASFSVERTDGVGFGPLGLSTFVDVPRRRALKLLRRKDLGPTPWSGGDLMFRYDELGVRLLFLTRGLARTRVELGAYQRMFGSSLVDDFAEALAALGAAGLTVIDSSSLALTPTGMFYADAVVSVLASSAATSAGAGLHTRDLLREMPRAGEYYGMG